MPRGLQAKISAASQRVPARSPSAGVCSERSTNRAASSEIIPAPWCLGALGLTATSESELLVLLPLIAWLFWGQLGKTLVSSISQVRPSTLRFVPSSYCS